MPVTYYPNGSGTGRTASETFIVWQHPGGSDVRDMPRTLREAVGQNRAQELASSARNGEWILVDDGRATVHELFPYLVEGDLGGELGFGGSAPAEIGILNEGYTARQSFEVSSGPDGKWTTKVDGQVVDSDTEFHPFYIAWRGGGSVGGLGGML